MTTSIGSSTGSTTSSATTGTNATSTAASSTTASSTAASSTAASNIVNTLGAGSGIDTKSLAASLVAAERAPREAAINKNINKEQATISGFAAVKYAISNLQAAFDDLKDKSDFKSITATNSNPSAFTVTTSLSADPGTHSIKVESLAAPQRTTGSIGFAKSSTPINGGSAMSLSVDIAQSSTGATGFAEKTSSINAGGAMTLTLGGGAFGSGQTIPIEAGNDTPQGIADAITNAQLGLSAEVIDTGDASKPYKVVVTGTAGSGNDFTISSDASGIDFGTTIKAASTATISIAGGKDTPAGVVDAVNNAGIGLSAQLVNTGDPSKPYKIALSGASGKYNAFSVTSSVPSALDFGTLLQPASNASLTVDGIKISSSSNTVNDVITGVTLNLLSTTSTTATVGLNNDTTAAQTKVGALVTAYNDAMNIFDELTNPKSTLATYGGTMVGNSTINSLRTQLRSMVTQDSSSKSASGDLSALRDIGIEIDSHGLLKSNSVKLDLALNTDFANTVSLLSGNQENQGTYDSAVSGIAGDGSKAITKLLSSTGTIARETANANDRITKDQDDLTKLDDRMTQLLARYTKQFAAMDSIVGQTKSTQTGLTSSFAGLMAMYTKN